MAQLVKCLHKHGDLSLDAQNSRRKLGVVVYLNNPSVEEAETGGGSLEVMGSLEVSQAS